MEAGNGVCIALIEKIGVAQGKIGGSRSLTGVGVSVGRYAQYAAGVRRVASCWAIGRSSVEATKASLILWARAVRRRRSAGLTYFFLPRGAVAERCVVVDVFRALDEPRFFARRGVAGSGRLFGDELAAGFFVL